MKQVVHRYRRRRYEGPQLDTRLLHSDLNVTRLDRLIHSRDQLGLDMVSDSGHVRGRDIPGQSGNIREQHL